MFEKASRKKYRFPSSTGLITVEDLWNLPLTHPTNSCLDDVAKALNVQLKDTEQDSFVDKEQKIDEDLECKFAIVLHIIKVKVEEREHAKNAAVNKATKEKIMAVLARKQDNALEEADEEDLRKMLDELG